MGLGIAALVSLLLAGAGAGAQWGFGDAKSKEAKNVRNKTSTTYGLSNSDAQALLSNYKNYDAFNILNPSTWGDQYDTDALAQDYADYLKWKGKVGDMPDLPDWDSIMAEASDTIDRENAQINSMYDSMLARSTDVYNNSLLDNNQAYNDYANQIMSNQAQSQSMLQGSIRNEMSRAQRNAIVRGASAAQRLVSNINTQLGMQNKAAQQSLDTSNALAQQLLAQRQAATQMRNDYQSSLNNDANRRASLMQGSAERKMNYQNAAYNQAQEGYNAKMDAWNDRLNAYGGTNPFTDVERQNAYKDRVSGGSRGL